MPTVTLEEQVDQLERCVEAFAGSVASFEERLFLRKVTSWTARDIAAHLIGWNRYVVRGARQILRGELPFYDVDPGPNYSRERCARSRVRRYGSIGAAREPGGVDKGIDGLPAGY